MSVGNDTNVRVMSPQTVDTDIGAGLMDATKEDIPLIKTTNLDDEKKLETNQTQKSTKKKVTIIAESEEVHSANESCDLSKEDSDTFSRKKESSRSCCSS